MTESNASVIRQPEISGLDSPAVSSGRNQTRPGLTEPATAGARVARLAGAPAIIGAIGFCSRGATMVAVTSRRLVGVLLGLGLGMVLAALMLVSPAWAAGVNSQSFTTPGGPFTYTVPAGVSSVHVDAIGGAGGSSSDGNPGGQGAEVAADLPVTSGEALSVYVAGDGIPEADGGPTGSAGTNGGGNPGGPGSPGGGGGASDVRTTPGDLSSRLLVAAGGGGAMTFGTAGAAGQEGTSGGGCDGTPSMPGTQTAGGAGGGGCPAGIADGSSGSFGSGGNGGDNPFGYNDNGGGGGGGWYGGGGGGAYGGGAGGSNFVARAGSNLTTSLTGNAPQVTISYSPGAATNLSLRVAPSSIVANGASTSTATATITDANGNPVAGDTVAFSSSDPGDQIGAVTNNGDGTYTATITSSTTSQPATITATDNTVSPSISRSATLTETPGPAAKVTVGLVPSSILADGSSTSTATATLTDANGNPETGDSVAFSSSAPGERIGAVTNEGGGTYTATITSSTTAGPATITATDSSVTPSISGSAVLTQTAPVVSKLADLKVTINGATKAADGSTFIESVTVSNSGPGAATNVLTGLVTPAQITVTNAGGGSQTGPAVSWTDHSIPAGVSVTHMVTSKVAAHAHGNVLMPVAAGSTQVKDPNYLNNVAVQTITLG